MKYSKLVICQCDAALTLSATNYSGNFPKVLGKIAFNFAALKRKKAWIIQAFCKFTI